MRPRLKNNPDAGRQKPTSPADAQKRAFDAIRRVKGGKSLTRAAKLAHTSVRTVLKYAAGALTKSDGVYVAQVFDRSPRRMKVITPTGLSVETITGSRVATRIGTYMSAVDHYLTKGDASRLRQFVGKAIRAGRKRFALVTDLRLLRRLAFANEIAFEDIYGEIAV